MPQPRLKRSTLKERANEARRQEALPKNPIRSFRQSINDSHTVLAKRMGVTKQALIRAEQGCYEEIPPSILSFLVNEGGENELVLRDSYEGYRQEMRKRNIRYFGDLTEFYSENINPYLHPLLALQVSNGVNTTQIAKDLCLSQATLSHWIKHWRIQQSVPKTFIKCLRDIGYRNTEIEALEIRYYNFRKVAKDVGNK